MPAFNFKAQFADAVRRLEKRQTIRAWGKRRPPRVGEPLMLYTGMRTSACRKLLDAECTSVVPISINCSEKSIQMPRALGNKQVFMYLYQDEVEALAKADVFQSTDDLFSWFEANHGRFFSGYLIKW